VERKRRIVPPVYLLLTLAAMVALHRYAPVAQLIVAPYSHAGWLLVAAGVGIAAVAAGAFRRAGTGIVPFDPATALVTEGLYRFTRNPMYLGMVMLLTGVAIALGSVGAFLPIPVFVGIIHAWFIVGEERFLEDTFGESYLAYKRSVRRWL
jgi:protein-S-isoprenylcysteine O-methyltransferase Ste14